MCFYEYFRLFLENQNKLENIMVIPLKFKGESENTPSPELSRALPFADRSPYGLSGRRSVFQNLDTPFLGDSLEAAVGVSNSDRNFTAMPIPAEMFNEEFLELEVLEMIAHMLQARIVEGHFLILPFSNSSL